MPRKALIVLAVLMLMAPLALSAEEWATHTDGQKGYSVRHPVSWQVTSDSATGFFEARTQPDKAAPASTFSVVVTELSELDRNSDFYDYMAKGQAELKREFEANGFRNIRVVSSVADTLNGSVVHRLELRSDQYGSLAMRTQIVRIRHKNWHFTLTCSAEDGYYYDLARDDFEGMISSFRFQVNLPAYLKDYVRVRADLDGRETVWHWQGTVYGLVPGEKRRELFALEGYYIVRAESRDNGYVLVGREASLLLDHRTGLIAETWRNPYTGKDVPVLQIFNDPVNQDLTFEEQDFPFLPQILPRSELGGKLAYYSEIFPYSTNPLQRKDFPLNSQNNTYQAAEFSQYLVDAADLADPALTGVPAVYTFTRIQPWLPFMLMGERAGNVVLVGRGSKVPEGFSGLPQYLQDYVTQRHPEFAHAPETYTQPNATAWSYFKKLTEVERSTTQELPER